MSDELKRWVDTVDDWGGRLSSPQRKTVLKELGQSQLGVSRRLPTTGPVGEIPRTVLLAQVSLSKAIPMEVSFSYENMRSPEGVFPLVNLDQGNGFVRITWGTPGTFSNIADVDGNSGWRKVFVASFMRVEYVPIDPENFNRIIPGGQARDLSVQAMIAPAYGDTPEPLTKTVFFPDLAVAATAFGQIPRWAKTVQIVASWPGLPQFAVLLQEESSAAVSTFGSDLSLNAPFWAAIKKHPVPQRAQRVFLAILPASTVGANRPKAVFELAL